MINFIKKLIPLKGSLWHYLSGGQLDLFLEALSAEPKRIRDHAFGIITESNPGTAIETQEEWYNQYGLKYNSTKSIEEQQAETLERYIALGGQDIVYIQDQVEKAGFDEITIIENTLPIYDEENQCGIAETGGAVCGGAGVLGSDWIFYFYVRGEVDTDDELDRLKALIQRLAPGHLIPIYQVTSSDNICGVAVCGEAVCDG